jgi:AraC family transcriptional regulator, regulatory protein of adaptative response / methylated-DNA-[protein]-cysteine methyltransferase
MKVIARPASKQKRGRGLTLTWGIHPFPVGKILVALSDEGLCWLGIDCGVNRLARDWPGATLIEDRTTTRKAAAEIAELWPDGLEKLSIPLVLYGTSFQLKVWKELLKIKSGSLSTYAAVAHKIGAPKAMRAVGSAVGRNTVSIVVPCHRVVNKDSSRINYGWGPEIKLALLKGEKAL